MIYFLFGAAGALAVVGLIACGFLIGWKCEKAVANFTGERSAEEATEEQKRLVREQQRAFEAMLGYNADTAYNMGGMELE